MAATFFTYLRLLTTHAFIVCVLLACCLKGVAQAITVTPVQPMAFGAFFQGASGGTVSISNTGVRSVTGSIVLANFGIAYSPALFKVTANPLIAVEVLNGSDVNLTGSNGGTIKLHLGLPSTGILFLSLSGPPAFTNVYFGGTLTVGAPAANPSGSYSGTFQVTFLYE